MYSINTHICNENMYEAIYWGFPGGAGVKNLPANAGETRDVSLIPGSGRSPRIGNGNPLQYSCLENPMNRGAWRATVYGVAECECACTHARTHTHTHTLPPLFLCFVMRLSMVPISLFVHCPVHITFSPSSTRNSAG